MSKKVWIIFASVCVLLLAGLIIVSNNNRLDVSNVDTTTAQGPSEQSGNIGDHALGKLDSKVTLIEYGDFQCPGCSSAFPTVEKVVEKYKGEIGFVFRNFPLTSIHPNARAAAAAAEAAGQQDKFWEMYRLLYEQQNNWESLGTTERTDYFTGLAEELDLDREAFIRDMTAETTTQKINFDIALGKKDGVDSTPTFLLNGEQLDSAVWQSEETFDQAIADAIKTAN